METNAYTRRDFVKMTVATGLAVGTSASALAVEKRGDVPYRTLGRTGEKVSCIGLGGFHIGNPNPDEATRIIRTAIDSGINFMDNCWDYHDGDSEVRMGKALRDGYRDKVFLMTKIDGRHKTAAAKQI
ncbi:MAG: aldo/keto reductase, partial [Limisphaerales bacterium]